MQTADLSQGQQQPARHESPGARLAGMGGPARSKGRNGRMVQGQGHGNELQPQGLATAGSRPERGQGKPAYRLATGSARQDRRGNNPACSTAWKPRGSASCRCGTVSTRPRRPAGCKGTSWQALPNSRRKSARKGNWPASPPSEPKTTANARGADGRPGPESR